MDQLKLDLVLDTSNATQSSNKFFNTFEQNVANLNRQLDNVSNPRNIQFKVVGQQTLDQAASKMNNIDKNTKKVKDRVAALNGEWEQTPNKIRAQVKYLEEVRGRTKKYTDDTGRISSGWIKVNDRVQEGLNLLRQKTNGGFLDQADKMTGTLQGKVAALNGEWGRTPAQIRGQVTYLQQVLDNTTKYNKKTGELTPQWTKVNAKVQEGLGLLRKKVSGGFLQQTKSLLSPMTAKFALANIAASLFQKALQAVVSTAISVGQQAVQRAADIQALQLALAGVVPVGTEVNDVLKAAVTDSLAYGSSLQGVEKAYQRLTPVITASGGTMQDVRDVIVSLAARSTELGLNTEQSGRYMEAFAQVMGKGKLQAEELNQQFAELDGALRVQIAKYLEANYGISDLNKAMSDGAVTADIFREAFVAISKGSVEKLKKQIGELNQNVFSLGEVGGTTINQLNQQLNTLWQISLSNVSQAFEGLTEFVYASATAVLTFIATFPEKFPAAIALVEGLADAMGGSLYGAVTLLVQTGNLAGAAFEGLVKSVTAVFFPAKRLFDFANANLPPFTKGVEQLGRAWEFFSGILPKVNDATNNLNNSSQILNGTLDAEEITLKKLNQALEEGKITTEQYDEAVEDLAQAEEKVIRNQYIQELEKRKIALKEQIGKEKELQGAIREKMKEEREGHREMQSAVRERYSNEIGQIRTAKNEALAKLDAELGRLNAMTPVQERLQEIRRKKIEEQLRSGELSEEERLLLIDQLEEMDRQKERRRIKAEKQKISKKAEEDEKKLLEEQKKEMDKLNNRMEINIGRLNDLLETSERRVDNMEQGYSAIDEEISRAENGQAAYNVTLQYAETYSDNLSSANTTLGNSYSNLATRIGNTADSYKKLAAAIREVNRAKAGAKAGPDGRAEGGPVAGGTKYTVNEMGKEAFLSASGKLSMINAPAWGEWRAPSSGTVIPAHLTSQLDIPSGGVNLNSAAMNRGMGPGRTVSNVRHGDNINNTVTIQTTKPRQAASDVMVQLAKLKRVRYS